MQTGAQDEWKLIEDVILAEDVDAGTRISFSDLEEYNKFHLVCDFDVNGATQCYISINKMYPTAYHYGNISYKVAGNRTFDVVIETTDDGVLYSHGTYSSNGGSPVEYERAGNYNTAPPITQIDVWSHAAGMIAGSRFTLYGQK